MNFKFLMHSLSYPVRQRHWYPAWLHFLPMELFAPQSFGKNVVFLRLLFKLRKSATFLFASFLLSSRSFLQFLSFLPISDSSISSAVSAFFFIFRKGLFIIL